MEPQDLAPSLVTKTPNVRQRTVGLYWIGRITVGIVLAFVVGSMPVYIHHEIETLSRLKAELRDLHMLVKSMYVHMENADARLRALKTPRGAARIMREKGFVPPGARVYQVDLQKTVERKAGVIP